MTVALKVFEADNSTHVGDVEVGQFKACEFAEINSQSGGWSITLPNRVPTSSSNPTRISNPALSLLTIGRIVRFVISPEGVDLPVERFSGIVEDFDITSVSPEEEAGELTEVTGRGLLAILDKVCVRPDMGTDNLPFHPTRWFNFSADRLRDDDAAAPQGVWPAGVNNPPLYDNTTPLYGRPIGMVNTDPQWIWDADVTAGADAGTVYFRQVSTFPAGDTYFEFAADDEGELWVDGVPIIKLEGIYQGGCRTARVPLTAGEHRVTGFGVNLNSLQAGVTASWWTVSDALPDEIIGYLNETDCIVLAYPADPPGFTPTEVTRLVVDEVQSLPVPRLADVTFSYTSADDTDSADVDEVTDITCHAPGDSLLTLFEMLGETYLDISMTPDSLELNAWLRGTRGSDVSGSVAFTKGTCRRVTHEITGSERATVAVVSGSTFAPFEVVHADASTFDIYEEVALDFGDASAASAAKFALDYLNLVSQARKGLTLELVPEVGPMPYEDFGVGDTISVPGPTGGAEDRRVAAIGLALGPDSIMRWTVDLDQPRLLLEERLSRIMRRQLPGAAGGRTLLPATTTPSFVSNETGNEDVHTWQWDGPLGEIQLYVDGNAVTTGVVDAADLDPGESKRATVTGTNDAIDERRYNRGASRITFTAGGGDMSPEWVPPKGRWVQEVRATADTTVETITITISVA